MTAAVQSAEDPLSDASATFIFTVSIEKFSIGIGSYGVLSTAPFLCWGDEDEEIGKRRRSPLGDLVNPSTG